MRRRNALRFERLETRLTPAASVMFSGGSLRVIGDNQPNVIALGESGGVVGVTVITNGVTANFGPYLVTGSIYVDGSNGNDTINVSVTGALGGPIGLAGGLGNDVFNFQAVAAGASINGIVRIDGNIGNDAVNMAQGANRLTATDVHVASAVGIDSVTLQNVDLQGMFVANGSDSVFIGTDASFTAAARANINGQVVINNATEGIGGRLNIGAGSTLGSLTYVGGGGGDSVTIGAAGSATSGFNGEVLGQVALVLNGGNNSATFNNASLLGPVTITALGGADTINFDQNTQVPGNASLVLGDGANLVTSTTGVVFSGNLSINSGGGADSVGTGLVPFSATVAGTLQFNAGNGNNVMNYNGILSGGLTYNGGGGNDSVTVTGDFSGKLAAYLGAGNDTFNLGTPATRFTGGGLLDFGFGDDSFGFGDPVDWPLTIIGL